MVQDAEANAEEDKKNKENAELRNNADQLVFTVDKTLKELEGKVEEEEVKKQKQLAMSYKKRLKVKISMLLKKNRKLKRNRSKSIC